MAPSNSRISLQEIPSSQAVQAMDLQLRAFHAANNHHHSLIFPGHPDNDPDLAATHARSLTEGREADAAAGAEIRYWQAVDTAANDMAAVALWEFWPKGHAQKRPEVTWVRNADSSAEGALVKRYTEWALGVQYATRARYLSGTPYGLLEICFTAEAHRRKGAGRLIVDAGIARAEELGLDTYIEASPEGRLLYQACGYRDLETVYPECPEEFETVSGGNRVEYTFMKRLCGGWKD